MRGFRLPAFGFRLGFGFGFGPGASGFRCRMFGRGEIRARFAVAAHAADYRPAPEASGALPHKLLGLKGLERMNDFILPVLRDSDDR
jgi:hypothetical protein